MKNGWLNLVEKVDDLEVLNAAIVDVQTTYGERLAARMRHRTKEGYAQVLAAYGTTYANAWRNAREVAADEVARGFDE